MILFKVKAVQLNTVLASILFGIAATSFGQIAAAQSAQARSQTIVRQAMPDESTLARLVWTSMIALDNANRTDNYSVLRGLGTQQFAQANSPASLSATFSDLRSRRVDVGRTVLVSPAYYIPPQILSDGNLRLRGGFDFRPNSVRFDLLFQNESGAWRLNGISVVDMDAGAPK